MQPTTKTIEVTTHSGRRVRVIQVQHWIDTSSKDDPYGRAPGRKELRTMRHAFQLSRNRDPEGKSAYFGSGAHAHELFQGLTKPVFTSRMSS